MLGRQCLPVTSRPNPLGLARGEHRFDRRHLCVEIDVTFSDHLKLPIFENIPSGKAPASMHDDIALVDEFADLRAKQRDYVRHPNITIRGCAIDFKPVQKPADVSPSYQTSPSPLFVVNNFIGNPFGSISCR